MLDLSMGEIGVIAAIALVVLGPDKLPQVAKTAGYLTSWPAEVTESRTSLTCFSMESVVFFRLD